MDKDSVDDKELKTREEDSKLSLLLEFNFINKNKYDIFVFRRNNSPKETMKKFNITHNRVISVLKMVEKHMRKCDKWTFPLPALYSNALIYQTDIESKEQLKHQLDNGVLKLVKGSVFFKEKQIRDIGIKGFDEINVFVGNEKPSDSLNETKLNSKILQAILLLETYGYEVKKPNCQKS